MNPQNTPLTDGVIAVITQAKYNDRPAQKIAILQLHAEALDRRLNHLEDLLTELGQEVLAPWLMDENCSELRVTPLP